MDPWFCRSCGGNLRRSRRSGLERLLYSAAYRCEKCKLRVRVSHVEHISDARFVSCPKCNRTDLKILTRRDRVDRFSRNPLRLIQGFLGAKLYHCWSCRLQFYDFRKRRPPEEKTNAA